MIRCIRGMVVGKDTDGVVIDVHGIGYRVHVPFFVDPPLHAEILLHTHLAVRETSLDLYGFQDYTELQFFEALLTIPKVGPKTALGFMSQARVPTIKKAISDENPEYLAQMSEISKKNAEKIVLSLKGKIDHIKIQEEEGQIISDETSEIIETLIALGYSPRDAREAIASIDAGASDKKDKIRQALGALARK